MNFYEISVTTKTEGIDLVTAALSDILTGGFWIEDKEDFKEFLEGTELYWDFVDEELSRKMSDCETKIKFYLADNNQGRESIMVARDILLHLKNTDNSDIFGELNMEISNVKEEDWANNWKQYFKPFPVGKRMVVKPSWETYDNKDGRIIVEIDPMSSFGTGQHHTTRLCLEELENLIDEDSVVLDMGCGSGILSVAAALLGSKNITAVDIDENAVKTTNENTAKNNVNNVVSAFSGNIFENKSLRNRVESIKYNVICANIVADVIISMLSLFEKNLLNGGTLILSGIIKSRLSDVTDAIANYSLIIDNISEKEDWCCIRLIKRG